MFVCQVLFGDFLYDNYSEIPVETVPRLVEMSVYAYYVGPGYIVPMFVHSPVSALRLNLTNVLFLVALEA